MGEVLWASRSPQNLARCCLFGRTGEDLRFRGSLRLGGLWRRDLLSSSANVFNLNEEGRYTASMKREFKLPWRKAGPLKSSR